MKAYYVPLYVSSIYIWILLEISIKRLPQFSEETLDFGFLNSTETIKDQEDFQNWTGYILHQGMATSLWGTKVSLDLNVQCPS